MRRMNFMRTVIVFLTYLLIVLITCTVLFAIGVASTFIPVSY